MSDWKWTGLVRKFKSESGKTEIECSISTGTYNLTCTRDGWSMFTLQSPNSRSSAYYDNKARITSMPDAAEECEMIARTLIAMYDAKDEDELQKVLVAKAAEHGLAVLPAPAVTALVKTTQPYQSVSIAEPSWFKRFIAAGFKL